MGFSKGVAGIRGMTYLDAMRTPIFAALIAAIPISQAEAHPHVFVEVGVTLIYADGSPVAVRLEWKYDDYFSLLLTTDLGIDQDGDAVLTPQEFEVLTNSVEDWPDDYQGDLEVLQSGNAIKLGPKTDHVVTFEDGVVHEAHTRSLIGTVAPNIAVDVLPYDPYFYVAYDVLGAVTVEGRDDCVGALQSPDLEIANKMVETLLDGRSASDVGANEEFPAVGHLFAQTVTFTCA